jgi:hypothetical protein
MMKKWKKKTKKLIKLLTEPGLKDEQNWIEAWEILKQSIPEKMNRDWTILNESWIESKLNQRMRVEVNRKLNDYEVEWFLIEVEPNRSFLEMKLGLNNSELKLNEWIGGEWRRFKESEVWIWSLGWTRLKERRTKTNVRLNINKRSLNLKDFVSEMKKKRESKVWIWRICGWNENKEGIEWIFSRGVWYYCYKPRRFQRNGTNLRRYRIVASVV